MKSLSMLIQNKILLAILAGVTSIGSFQVWQHHKLEYEKFIAGKEKTCEVGFSLAQVSINYNPSLHRFIYNNIKSPALKQPGINTAFAKDSSYLLIKIKPDYLIPPNVDNYDSPLFKSLSKVGDTPPNPLEVKAISVDMVKKEALVSSYCSKTPFTVKLEDLYEKYQVDFGNLFGGADIFK
ncbi:hypothetical protein [Anabaena sp. UHCC 0399]|uniref:hypothetical protein n=1 Tax=Anabaena sp. UHCC 0399 TaxID=3110238 RepID=UPI002B1F0D74|nr:hypothetical protein [Anabaena sp. UHCC 0399]MEA5566634.1 hypothetical protein [Anabaena sp. UHCC 0399]